MKLELTDHSESLRKQIIQDLDNEIARRERSAKNFHISGDHYSAGLEENLIKTIQKTKEVFTRQKESNFHIDEKGVVYYK